jgi:drug/metabolite transporter (DMT)-like permease
MHWITAGLLMFVSSVVLYLTARKSSLSKMPVEFNNLAYFLIPTLVFAIAALFSFGEYNFSFVNVMLIIVAGILFSYAPSIASLKSIEAAPNPGYSLIISKSYVLLTTFLAIPLFNQHLTINAILAVLLIVFFSTLIIYNPKETRKKSSSSWLPLSLGAFFGWAFLSITAKYLSVHGIPPIAFLASIATVALTCIFIEVCVKKISLKPFMRDKWTFIVIGLASTSFNFFNFYAISIAPNIGYVNATNAASIGAVTIFAVLLFNDEFSPRKLIGVLGCIGSLGLLFLGG